MSDIGLSPEVARGIVLTMVVIVAGIFLLAFLIGSIPFGYLIGRFFYGMDIRQQGSGNIGAMNALRTMGKGGAIAVLLLDALKGFLPTFYFTFLFAPWNHLDLDFDPNFPPGAQILGSLVATAAVLGHCFSPWLRFKGGKGVATAFGAIFGLSWPAGLAGIGAYLVGAGLTHYSSVGSMLGIAISPLAFLVFTRSLPEVAFGIVAALVVILRHRDNIARLRAGTEGPINLSKRG